MLLCLVIADLAQPESRGHSNSRSSVRLIGDTVHKNIRSAHSLQDWEEHTKTLQPI